MAVPEAGASLGRPRGLAAPLLFGAFALFGLWFAWRTWDGGVDAGDEGIAAVDAWRLLRGEVPHADFFEIVPPVSFLPTALAFRLFGATVAAERGLSLLYALLLAVGCERLLARFTKDLTARALVVAFLVPFGVLNWPMPSHHWAATLLQVYALLALHAALRGPRPLAWSAAAGALAGWAGLSLQDQGALFALLVPLLGFPWVAEAARRRRLLAGWLLGLASAAAPVLLWLLSRVPPGELLRQWVLFPASQYATVNSSQFAFPWREIASALTGPGFREAPLVMAAYAVTQCFTTLLPPASLAAATALLLRRRGDELAEAGLLAGGALALVLTCLRRYMLTNLFWAAPVPLVLVAWAASAAAGPGRRPALRWLARGGAWVVTAACLLAAFHFGAVSSSPARTVTVRGPAGALRFTDPYRGGQLQELLDAVEREVPPGAPLFCRGYIPLVNFLALRPNPTRYTFFVPPYNTADQGAEWVRSLRRGGVVWGVSQTDRSRFLDGSGLYVVANYEPVWSNREFILWKARSAGGPP